MTFDILLPSIMLSGTLKERLAQYKTLKEEEEKNTELAATKSVTQEDAPAAEPNGTKEDAPGKCIRKEG